MSVVHSPPLNWRLCLLFARVRACVRVPFLLPVEFLITQRPLASRVFQEILTESFPRIEFRLSRISKHSRLVERIFFFEVSETRMENQIKIG